MPNVCAVPGCGKFEGFKFPTDPALCKRWQVAIRRAKPNKELWQPSKRSVVCDRHFKEDDFEVPMQSRADLEGFPDRRNRRLKVGVVPSLHLPNQPVVKSEVATQARQERANRRRERKETVFVKQVIFLVA